MDQHYTNIINESFVVDGNTWIGWAGIISEMDTNILPGGDVFRESNQ